MDAEQWIGAGPLLGVEEWFGAEEWTGADWWPVAPDSGGAQSSRRSRSRSRVSGDRPRPCSR
ncbi:hypothetical protein RKD18_006760 [Streptomyces phaeoluteigriseus]